MRDAIGFRQQLSTTSSFMQNLTRWLMTLYVQSPEGDSVGGVCTLWVFLLLLEFHLYIVYIIQVKVLLRTTLKLIVMISLNIHVMTSQDRTCVPCVTNGLQRNVAWLNTETDTLEKTCIHVFNVRNVFHLWVLCINIRIFTQVNTSAQNVADVVKVVET